MPDGCNFDSATHALKVESRVNQGYPFEGSTQLQFLGEKSETTLNFAPVCD